MGVKVAVSWQSITNEAIADTTGMTAAKWVVMQGAATPFTWNVLELYIGGEATASTVYIPKVARDSTVAATALTFTNGRVGELHPSSATHRIVPVTAATTAPQRGVLHLLSPSMNLFGGIIRWVAAPGEELVGVGVVQPFGEMSLSGFTGSGTGPSSGHFIIEEQ